VLGVVASVDPSALDEVRDLLTRHTAVRGHAGLSESRLRALAAAEVLDSFLAQFYLERPAPRLVLLSHEVASRESLREVLSGRAGHRIAIGAPQRGEKKELVDNALRNAREALSRKLAEAASQAKLLEALAAAFGLAAAPRRIEVYDNSHIMGTNAIGAMIVAGPGSSRVRVEAIDDHIVRIWLKPAGDFSRPQSLALAEAPVARVPLTIREEPGKVFLSTAALTVCIDRGTLGFEVVAREDDTPVLASARVATKADGTGWTLTHKVNNEEAFFGLGEDNENSGRLNRRGTIRDLWAGQRIKSGNVTAQYPIPLLLSTGRRGHAYGVFYDNVHELRFDLAKSASD